jgi:hypothetical protein
LFMPDVMWKVPENSSLMAATVVLVEFGTEVAVRLKNPNVGFTIGTELRIWVICTAVFVSVIVVDVLPLAVPMVRWSYCLARSAQRSG